MFADLNTQNNLKMLQADQEEAFESPYLTQKVFSDARDSVGGHDSFIARKAMTKDTSLLSERLPEKRIFCKKGTKEFLFPMYITRP